MVDVVIDRNKPIWKALWGDQIYTSDGLAKLDALFEGKSPEEIRVLVNEPLDNQGRVSLHYSCTRSWDETLFSNINTGIARDFAFPFYNPLDAKTVTRLIQAGADVNQADNRGLTPLHLVFEWESYGMPQQLPQPTVLLDIVKALVDIGKANASLTDDRGQTPLHRCASSSIDCKLEIMEFLMMSCGSDVNAQDQEGRTPLHLSHDTETVQCLLDKGANIDAVDCQGQTPLHLALFEEYNLGDVRLNFVRLNLGNPEKVKLLIDSGADLTIQASPLSDNDDDEAEEKSEEQDEHVKGRVSIFDCIPMALLKYVEDGIIGMVRHNLEGIVGFLVKVLPALIKHSTAKQRETHEELLNVAVVGGQMLQRVANEFVGDDDHHIMELIAPLLHMGADINYAGKPVELVDHSGEVNPWERYTTMAYDIDGYTPLHYLLSPYRLVDWCEGLRSIPGGLDGFILDIVNLVHEGIQNHGKGVNWGARSTDGSTLLHLAARNGYARTAERLVELFNEGVDKDTEEDKEEEGNPPFLEARAGPKGMTALHLAAWWSNEDHESSTVVETLLRLGANPMARTRDKNCTSLHVACEHAQSGGAVRCLLKDTDSTLWNALDSQGKSALHYAVGRGFESFCVLNPFYDLVQRNDNRNGDAVDSDTAALDVDISDNKGQTPLHVVCSVRWESSSDFHPIVKWLLDQSQVSHPALLLDKFGMTPLSWLSVQSSSKATLNSIFELLKRTQPPLVAGRKNMSANDGPASKKPRSGF